MGVGLDGTVELAASAKTRWTVDSDRTQRHHRIALAAKLARRLVAAAPIAGTACGTLAIRFARGLETRGFALGASAIRFACLSGALRRLRFTLPLFFGATGALGRARPIGCASTLQLVVATSLFGIDRSTTAAWRIGKRRRHGRPDEVQGHERCCQPTHSSVHAATLSRSWSQRKEVSCTADDGRPCCGQRASRGVTPARLWLYFGDVSRVAHWAYSSDGPDRIRNAAQNV